MLKKSFLYKLLALMLTVLLGGCAVSQGSGTLRAGFQDGNSQAAAYPYAKEYPSIDAEQVFKDGDIAASISNMAVTGAPAEVRAVWVSYLEFERILKNKSQRQFASSIQKMFLNIKAFGFNTVIVQVRPFGDALYPSGYFPWSHIITGTEGKNPGFDPLEMMVSESRKQGLRIEAWVNPYRIRPAGRDAALAGSNQARAWMEDNDGSVIAYNGIISYNPASLKAQDLIVNGVVEIVQKYGVDGIHIDDYFYPVTDKAFDQRAYDRYTGNGGNLSHDNWRRANVETLIKKMYDGIKKANRRVLFGISPQSSVRNNYSTHYFDVKKILSKPGYCDYICPQIYFGYENKTQPYYQTLKEWDNMVKAPGVKLYVGLAAYKCGTVDSWAGETGKNEWTENTDLLGRMTLDARKMKSYGGVAVYRYDSLFAPAANVAAAVKDEGENLGKLF